MRKRRGSVLLLEGFGVFLGVVFDGIEVVGVRREGLPESLVARKSFVARFGNQLAPNRFDVLLEALHAGELDVIARRELDQPVHGGHSGIAVVVKRLDDLRYARAIAAG